MRKRSRKPEKVRVYVLTEPDNGSIRYVGQAEDPQGRYQIHLRLSQLRGNNHKNFWVKSILAKGWKNTRFIYMKLQLKVEKSHPEVYTVYRWRIL